MTDRLLGPREPQQELLVSPDQVDQYLTARANSNTVTWQKGIWLQWHRIRRGWFRHEVNQERFGKNYGFQLDRPRITRTRLIGSDLHSGAGEHLIRVFLIDHNKNLSSLKDISPNGLAQVAREYHPRLLAKLLQDLKEQEMAQTPHLRDPIIKNV